MSSSVFRPEGYEETIRAVLARATVEERRVAASLRCFAWLYYDRHDETNLPSDTTCPRDGVRHPEACAVRHLCRLGFAVGERRLRMRRQRHAMPPIDEMIEHAIRAPADARVQPGKRPFRDLDSRVHQLLRTFRNELGNPPMLVARKWSDHETAVARVMREMGPLVVVACANYHDVRIWRHRAGAPPDQGDYHRLARLWSDTPERVRVDMIADLAGAMRAVPAVRFRLVALPAAQAKRWAGAAERWYVQHHDEATLFARVLLAQHQLARDEIVAWGMAAPAHARAEAVYAIVEAPALPPDAPPRPVESGE